MQASKTRKGRMCEKIKIVYKIWKSKEKIPNRENALDSKMYTKEGGR